MSLIAGIACVLACNGETRVFGDVRITEMTTGLWAQIRFPPESAVAKVMRRNPGNQIVRAVLEEQDSTLTYAFQLKAYGLPSIDELLIDAKTGAVLQAEQEDR